MELYSLNRAEPQIVNMLIFPDGSTRTGNDYTEEEYERAGYTGPYNRPEIDTSFQRLSWDSGNLQYVISDFSDEEYLNILRNQRDYLLSRSDVMMLEDYPINSENKTAVKNYRSYLRHLPQNIAEGILDIPKNRESFENILLSFEEYTAKINDSESSTN